MAVELASAYVSIIPSARGVGKTLSQELQGPATQAGNDAGKAIEAGIGGSLKKVAVSAAGIFAAKKIFDFAKSGFAELGEAQKVAAQTASAIKATGGAANVSADQVSDLAGRLSDLSGKDDELIQAGANLLLTFKNVRNEIGKSNDIFDRANQAALDLSVAGFGSVESASILMGKALNDPIKGLTALGRSGVTFSEDQKTAIKAMVETGDLLGAQKVILAEVEGQVGGAAKAYGETLPGQMERAQTAIDNTKASLIAGLAPAVEVGAKGAQFLATEIGKLPAGAQAAVGGIGLIGGTILSLAQPVNNAVDLFRKLRKAEQAVATAELATTVKNDASAVSALYASTGKAGGALAGMGTVLGLVGGAFVGATLLDKKFGKSLDDLIDGPISELSKRSTTELVRAFDDVGSKIEGTFGKTDAAKGQLALFDTLLEQNVGTAKRLRDALAEQGVDVSELDKRLRKASEGQKQLSSDQEAGADASDDAAAATDRQNQALEESQARYDGAREALTNYSDAITGSLDAQSKLAHADDAVEDALIRLNEAHQAVVDSKGKDLGLVEEEKRARLDAADAIRDQAQAAADYRVEQDAANGVTHTAAEKAGFFKEALQQQADTLKPDNPLRKLLDEYIFVLGTIPTHVPTSLDLYVSDLTKTGRRFNQAEADASRHRAGGGFVSAGQPYLVGEKGPEPFLPEVNGRIMSNAEFQEMLTAPPQWSGGDKVDIHVDRDSGAVARDIAREFEWRDRVRQLVPT